MAVRRAPLWPSFAVVGLAAGVVVGGGWALGAVRVGLATALVGAAVGALVGRETSLHHAGLELVLATCAAGLGLGAAFGAAPTSGAAGGLAAAATSLPASFAMLAASRAVTARDPVVRASERRRVWLYGALAVAITTGGVAAIHARAAFAPEVRVGLAAVLVMVFVVASDVRSLRRASTEHPAGMPSAPTPRELLGRSIGLSVLALVIATMTLSRTVVWLAVPARTTHVVAPSRPPAGDGSRR
jgi:hypothetical protein